MDIYILTKELEFVGLVDDYTSFQFTKHYDDIGDFQLTVNNRSKNASTLINGKVVLMRDKVNKAGIIDHVEINVNEDGLEQRIVKGKTLGAIFNDRLTLPNGEFDAVEDNVESVIRHYVNRNIINSIDESRNIEILSTTVNQNRGITIRWQTRFDTLSQVVHDICYLYNFGWDIDIDLENRTWFFYIYQGQDKSAKQDSVSPVIFSNKFGSVIGLDYLKNDAKYKNFAYVAGKGEGESRDIFEVGESKGFDRKETLIEVRPSEDEYIDVPEMGKRRLEEFSVIETFEADITQNKMFTYGQDYYLGDLVTVEDEDWGVSLDRQITSITEIYEDNRYSITASFGTKTLSMIDRLKQELKVFEPYTKK
jgi:hypothetical protein